jgi:2,3-bisphosphoglycerate-independent phosphoglycerate mutase
MGNSEVGHQNIGAGRIVDQEILRISKAVRYGTFFDNQEALGAYERAHETGGKVHLIGLCSDAGVHSSLGHLYACVELAKRTGFNPDKVFIHAISDGRDSPPTSGVNYIRQIETVLREMGVGCVASVIGRYYAMDRDNRWDRVEKAYRLFTRGRGRRVQSAVEAFEYYYEHPSEASRYGDEFIEPSVVCHRRTPLALVRDGDSVIFFNFRGDRPREITKAFVYNDFPFLTVDKDGTEKSMGFERGEKLDLYYACMTAYEEGLPVHVIFQRPPKMQDIFGEYIARLGLRQYRTAETEKFPHVTFFFNDYRDDPFEGEVRKIIPSPRDVSTYDHKPEMSANEVADSTVAAIKSGSYDVMVVNFANGDMVGHTGNLEAAVKAVETVDSCVGRVVEATLQAGGHMIVTADHGNCEQMIDPDSGRPHTAHTTYEVEAILVDDELKGRELRANGELADLIPTGLEMMGLDQPEAMTGRSLLDLAPESGENGIAPQPNSSSASWPIKSLDD